MFQPKSFLLPKDLPFSQKTLENHIKLYEGYVKNANGILGKIEAYSDDPTENAIILGELHRRFSFEFDGMRNHEYYFQALEGGPFALKASSPLHKALSDTWGNFESFFSRFKTLATTRGIGWAMLYYDPSTNRLLMQWVDEQHLGHLTGLVPIIALDMWEHAYLMDKPSSEKGIYVDDYLSALNWEKIHDWFVRASV